MSYYKIAGLVMEVKWPEQNPQIAYYLRHDCAVLPRSLGAFEMYEEVPEHIDLEVTVGNVSPYQPSEHVKIIGNQIFAESADKFVITYFLPPFINNPFCSLIISKDYSKAELIAHTKEQLNYDLQRVQHAFEGRNLVLGQIVLHGAAIEWNNRGFIFTGISGAGKSTQAHLWQQKERAIIINGDCPVIRKDGDEVTVCGTPWCGTSGEYINREVRLDSIILVKKALTNSVRELSGNEKFMTVLSQVLRSNGDQASLDLSIKNINNFIDDIKVYVLECTKDEDAVNCLKKVLE